MGSLHTHTGPLAVTFVIIAAAYQSTDCEQSLFTLTKRSNKTFQMRLPSLQARPWQCAPKNVNFTLIIALLTHSDYAQITFRSHSDHTQIIFWSPAWDLHSLRELKSTVGLLNEAAVFGGYSRWQAAILGIWKLMVTIWEQNRRGSTIAASGNISLDSKEDSRERKCF